MKRTRWNSGDSAQSTVSHSSVLCGDVDYAHIPTFKVYKISTIFLIVQYYLTHLHFHTDLILRMFHVFPPDRLLFVINTIKEEIVARVQDTSPRPTNMTDTLEHLIQETLGENHSWLLRRNRSRSNLNDDYIC